MTELVRPWRGVSAEDRQAERRERLLDACLDVVGTGGVANATVDRVCAEARLTKRYFYESFADLDALLLATADTLFDELRDQMQTTIAELPEGNARTHAVVTILIDALSGDRRRARLYVESPGHPVLRLRREQAIAAFTEFVATAVLPAAPPQITPERRMLATRLLVAGTTDLVTSWLAGDIAADRDAIIEAIEQIGAGA